MKKFQELIERPSHLRKTKKSGFHQSRCENFLHDCYERLSQSYSKSKLKLESNLDKILPVIASLYSSLSVVLSQLNLTKLKLEYLKFGL